MRPARTITARYAGTCTDCAQPIAAGETIHYRKPDAVHERCTLPDAPSSTHRERLEAKADRRDQWAEARAGHAAQRLETADRMASVIPFGQPILVGHYSEGRDRRYRDRITGNMVKGFEHLDAAKTHAAKAAGIRSQTAGAIYDDDPDAIERLQAKLADLEAERAAINAYNKAARKGTVTPELVAALAPKWRSRYADAGETIASYATANLGGNITRARQRLARLERNAQ